MTGPATATVAVIGGGAAGVLCAVQFAAAADTTMRRLQILLIEPHEPARGVAYATRDPRHRINVPAARMSAFPDDPDHFIRWLHRHVDATFPATGFAARQHFGDYLAQVLDDGSA